MKAKLLIFILSFVALTGCCSTGSNGCGGCQSSYWSTTCDVPNSGGAAESAFTDVGSVCPAGNCECHVCNVGYYSNCKSCGAYAGPNW